jgi:hypothetical protein
MIPSITLFDLVLSVIYLFIIYFFAVIYKKNKITEENHYKYFIPVLTLKIAGGILFALVSIYYYKGGDTFVFFNAAEGLRNWIIHDTSSALEVFFISGEEFDPVIYDFAPAYNYILNANDVINIVKITALVNIVSVGNYLTSSILFSFISFLGLWFAYSNFCKIYPTIKKTLLIGFFLVPTTLLWSSGILKDTITTSAIAWMIYGVSNIIRFHKNIFPNLMLVSFNIYIIYLLKPYILYLLIPMIFIWIQSYIKTIIKSSFFRNLLTPFLLVLFIYGIYNIINIISSENTKYSLENMENTLLGFQNWHTYLAENRDQSGYNLGEIELTPTGILKKLPAAINVTFFRPYFWEIRNLPTLLSAIESFILFLFVLKFLIKLKFRFFSIIYKNKDVLFLMLFSLTFAFIVGISSYNYGALSRYKIPAEVFFITALVIMNYESKINDPTNYSK